MFAEVRDKNEKPILGRISRFQKREKLSPVIRWTDTLCGIGIDEVE